MIDPKVIIVGAGPTGMTAALDLACFGVPSLVLDEDHQLSGGSRAIAYHHATLEVWEKLGAAGPMLAKGVAWSVRHTYYQDRELFAQTFPRPAPGMLPRFFNLQQSYVERYLLERIQASPLIDLRWDHRWWTCGRKGRWAPGRGLRWRWRRPPGSCRCRAITSWPATAPAARCAGCWPWISPA